jgi:hypothetical protein
MDTSILVNLLNLPGKADRHADIVEQVGQKRHSGITLILPTAAVIETGNHVCGLKDGTARRDRAQKFAKLLKLSVEAQTPWALHRATWDEKLLGYMIAGVDTGRDLVEHATMRRLGAGDLSILAERKLYQQSVSTKAVRVEVWTIDDKLEQDAHGST